MTDTEQDHSSLSKTLWVLFWRAIGGWAGGKGIGKMWLGWELGPEFIIIGLLCLIFASLEARS